MRIKKIRQDLIKKGIDAVLISSTPHIIYLTGYANFSEREREAYLLIGEDFQYIITDARYSEAIKREVPHFNLFERSHTNKLENLLKELKDKIAVLGIEENNLTVSEHKFFRKHFKKLKHFSPNSHRTVKNKEEINKIQKACQLGDKTFEYALTKIKIGISEKELAFEIEFFIKKNGADLSFPSIVAFGKNSSVPHHHTDSDTLTNKGQFVLLDFGVKFENYCSDMTRTVFFGQPTGKQRKIYETALEAQKKAIKFINLQTKLGKMIKASAVDKIAREQIASKGFPTIPHSLGHGVGLEVHEHPSLSPKSKDLLREGMVFSIEPGIYIPGFGGVRIEDLFVITKNGLKQLTTASKELLIIK